MRKKSLIGIATTALACLGVQTVHADEKSVHENAALFDFEHVSCRGAENEVRIVIKGVKKAVGLITVDLYENNDDTFLKRAGRVGRARFAAKAPMTTLCLKAPDIGDYAMAVYHDKNANKTFDKNAFGLPAEPWGISNNPRVRLGPPPVADALFSVDNDGAEIAISLN